MATEMAMSFSQSMNAVNFGHGYPLHHHPHQLDGYDYYTQHRRYQDHVMATHQGQQVDGMANEDIEVGDEDSDNESMYTSADMDSEVASEDLADTEPNVAEQLLEFAETVNRDIQKYFGRKKSTHEPESVGTIYEDRFASGKSGRELYYADLLRVAQNGDMAEPYTIGRSRRSGTSTSPPTSDNTDGVNASYTCKKGLGPLKELFDFAAESNIDSAHIGQRNAQWPLRESTRKCHLALPWRQRALPSSFFVEPGSRLPTRSYASGTMGYDPHITMVPENETPDFSDLVANFTSDYDTQMTSTAVSQ